MKHVLTLLIVFDVTKSWLGTGLVTLAWWHWIVSSVLGVTALAASVVPGKRTLEPRPDHKEPVMQPCPDSTDATAWRHKGAHWDTNRRARLPSLHMTVQRNWTSSRFLWYDLTFAIHDLFVLPRYRIGGGCHARIGETTLGIYLWGGFPHCRQCPYSAEVGQSCAMGEQVWACVSTVIRDSSSHDLVYDIADYEQCLVPGRREVRVSDRFRGRVKIEVGTMFKYQFKTCLTYDSSFPPIILNSSMFWFCRELVLSETFWG